MYRGIKLGLASVAIVLALLASWPSSAALAASSKPGVDPSAPVPVNGKLVSSLDARGRCLFDNDVYPAGGVGFRDSSLPYDDLEPVPRAEQTLRAQILRRHAEQVMEVSFTGSAATVTMSKASVRGAAPTVDDLATGDRAAADALATLRAAGHQVVVDSLDAPSLLDVCEIRRVIGTIATKIPAISVTPNAAEGKLDVTVNAESMPLVEAALHGFASWIRLESGDLALASRTADSAPWYGGASLNSWDGGFLCSTSFRFNNGSQYLLTADHCGPSGFKWYNNGNMYTGGYVGYSASNLGAYGVDTAVIAGSSYGARVYTGSTTSNTSIAANGVYPNSALQYGDQLVISGAASGQGNITATGLSETCIWFNNANYQYCHLLNFSAVGGVCIGGDSGGPIGVYDPANGRLIASATVTGTRNPTSSDHWCYGTNISAAIYLWGGGTIG